MTGLYLHIPFCHARCGYCDFVTFTGQEASIDRYVDALIRELSLVGDRFAAIDSIETIFFGGGTPSLLSGAQVQKVLAAVDARWGKVFREVTLECNPESVELEKARRWREAGVTRISLGLQTLDDALLKKIGRLHTAAEFHGAYRAVREAGFNNVSVDLIYGFEGQSLDSWHQTLEGTIAVAPEHLSLYALAVEDHTPFAVSKHEVDNELQASMYAAAQEVLGAAHYAQYEISNFAKPGLECAHNMVYWRQQNYLAAGVGAVGCIDSLRWQGAKDFHSYYAAVDQGKLPWQSVEVLDQATRKFERLMLGLRLREGLPWSDEPDDRWKKERARLNAEGLLETTASGHWRITERGIPLTNQILLPFL